MKRLYTITLLLASMLLSCGGEKGEAQKQKVSDGLWTFDVTKEYPTKEIYIQDIADVDYIPLETNDSMLWIGREIRYLDEDYIVGGFEQINIHDGSGKALNSFSRKGQGPEEYEFPLSVRFDKEADEIYVLSFGEYCVYDSKGNFKRALNTNGQSKNSKIEHFSILNEKEILQYDRFSNVYTRISKETGEVVEELNIGKDSSQTLMFIHNNMAVNFSATYHIKNKNGFILNSLASDTTWLLDHNLQLKPIGVKIPSLKNMEYPIYQFPVKNTSRYYFTYTVEKKPRYPTKFYMIDKKENQIYRLNTYIKNLDYLDQVIDLDAYGLPDSDYPANICVQCLYAYKLCEAYEKGKLSGKLKDIAAKLNEDDNPVLMIIKFKE